MVFCCTIFNKLETIPQISTKVLKNFYKSAESLTSAFCNDCIFSFSFFSTEISGYPCAYVCLVSGLHVSSATASKTFYSINTTLEDS